MKKQLNKKLGLNKSTVSNLNSLDREQLDRARGGREHVTWTYFDETCVMCDTDLSCTFTQDYMCNTTVV